MKAAPFLRLGLCAFAASLLPISDSSASLAALWQFTLNSTTQIDSTANGNTANSTNGAAWFNDPIRNGTMSFDGVDDFLQAADSPSLSINGSMTIAAWVNLTAAGGGGQWRALMAKDPPGSDIPGPYQAWFNQGNSLLGFGRGNGTANDFAFGASDGASIPTPGVWQHWAIVMNGTSVTMYRNATAISMLDTSIVTTIADGGGNLIIGDRPGAADMSFFGRLDDVAIFDEALSPTQVSTIMSGNFAAFGVPEPSSAALLLLTGAAGVLLRRRSRAKPGTPTAKR